MPLVVETKATDHGSYLHITGDSFDEVQSAINRVMNADDTMSAEFSLPRRTGNCFEAHGLTLSRSIALSL